MRVNQLAEALAARDNAGLRRGSQIVERAQGRVLHTADGKVLNFSANDYLGLASSPELQQALAEGAYRYGVGSTGSPLVTGYHRAHQALSEQLAAWLGFERVLLFSSGFAANQCMLQTLCSKHDKLWLDKLSHASLIDAALPQQGNFKRFAHNDIAALARLLAASATESVSASAHSLVVTEGVFSMDGDSPDLLALSALCEQYDAALLLDDAHGLGVMGDQGRGSWYAQGLATNQLYCYMANFGKAMGVGGAFLAGSRTVIDYIEQFGRHYVYSTALSPALCVAISKSIVLVQTGDWRRQKLADNIRLFRQLAAAASLPCLPVTGAIQAIMVGDAEVAMRYSMQLRAHGIWLSAIRPPTVPNGTARLRVTLSASHTPDDIRYLITVLQQIVAGSAC